MKIASLNCNSIRNSERLQAVRTLCADNDIIALQETMLPKEELQFLSSIDSEFCGRGISPVSLMDGPINGRPHGGLAFLWRKSLSPYVSIVLLDDERLLGLQVTCNGGTTITLFNIYLPYDCPDNRELFEEYMGKISSLVEESSTNCLCFIGDFNVDPHRPKYAQLQQMCVDHDLCIVDAELLPAHTFSYISDSHHTTSWLDHAVMNAACRALVHSIDVKYTVTVRDHMPLCVVLKCVPAAVSDECCTVFRARPLWDAVSSADIANYAADTNTLLGAIHLPTECITCCDVNCSVHENQISSLYTNICSCLLRAGERSLPQTRNRACGHLHIPGWNDLVKDKYEYSRALFLQWIDAGKPRFGYLCEEYRRAKLNFKYALRQCRRNENMHTSDKLAAPLFDGDGKKFWSRIRRMNSKPKLPTSVDTASDSEAICDMWRSKYERLFNSVNDDSCRKDVETALGNVHYEQGLRVSTSEVGNALAKLKIGKSAGPDGISAEHLKYAGPKLVVLLSLLFNAMLIHGFLPNDLMKCELIPVIKDLGGDLCSSDNYRPIAIASIVSKLFELVLLERMKSFIDTCDNQFGFKQNSGTEICVAVLKETINFYNRNSSNVYTCFLDASKAFDRTNHYSLFKKLLKREVPVYLVRILATWYRSQNFAAKWGDCISRSFQVTNGVRQGGILSPYLFNVFMDDLSSLLNKSMYGCKINAVRLNHIFYADDLCLIATSVYALQKLIEICKDFACQESIVFNERKSNCVYFMCKKLKNVKPGTVKLGSSCIANVEQEKYLGHILSSTMKDAEDMARQKRLFYARGNSLIRKFKFCSIQVKRTLFRAYCTSFYCCAIWSKYSQNDIQSVKVAYNNIVRGFFGISRLSSVTDACRDLGIPNFRDIYKNSMCSLSTRIVKSNNVYVRACFTLTASDLFSFYRTVI